MIAKHDSLGKRPENPLVVRVISITENRAVVLRYARLKTAGAGGQRGLQSQAVFGMREIEVPDTHAALGNPPLPGRRSGVDPRAQRAEPRDGVLARAPIVTGGAAVFVDRLQLLAGAVGENGRRHLTVVAVEGHVRIDPAVDSVTVFPGDGRSAVFRVLNVSPTRPALCL